MLNRFNNNSVSKFYNKPVTVFFNTLRGRKMMRMNGSNAAHLVTDYLKKSASIFKEDFIFSFGGESVSYIGFKIKVKGDPNFSLEYGLN